MTWVDLTRLAIFALLYSRFRARFARLPLHMDSGFYVTNDAIVERRYRPFRGWNTYFSGNGRLLPEWAHSALYLRTGAQYYAESFRSLYTWLAFVAAVGHGLTAAALLRTPDAFWPGAITSAVLLSEAQYGPYFESAEAFEVALQGLGLACVCWGLALGFVWLPALGLGLLWLDVVLVKSSAALPSALVSLVVAAHGGGLRLATFMLAALGLLGVGLLLTAAEPSVQEKLLYMKRHEHYVRRNYSNPLHLTAVKLGFSAKLLACEPLLPLFAALGALALAGQRIGPRVPEPGLWAYAALGGGALLALLTQGNRVWYYMLPFVGLLGPLCAAAELYIERVLGELPGVLCALVVIALAALINLSKVRGRDVRLHNLRVFAPYNRRGAPFGTRFAQSNYEVQQACEQLRERVRGHSVLVVGGHNQAYLQLEAAYATPIVSVCELSAAVSGDLRHFLPGPPQQRAPEYILDTALALPDARFDLAWLSNYQLTASHGTIRLFQLLGNDAESQL